jgi:hypothetical protein
MKFFNTIQKLLKAKSSKNPLDGKTYEEQVDFIIRCLKEFQGIEIENLKFEAESNFHFEKLEEIKILVKGLEFEKIKEQFNTKPKTFEDLAYFSFTDQLQKKYVAIIYDSDELWQDPQVFDIIAINE